MRMQEPVVLLEKTIDLERDVKTQVLATSGYNGEWHATVLCTGVPVAFFDLGSTEHPVTWLRSFGGDQWDDVEQSLAAFWAQLGWVSAESYENLVNETGGVSLETLLSEVRASAAAEVLEYRERVNALFREKVSEDER
jgi:hypothetical protein